MKAHKDFEMNEPLAFYGVSDDARIFSLIEKIKKGVSFAVFDKVLKSSPFKISEWAVFLHLSDRTMQRYQKENKRCVK